MRTDALARARRGGRGRGAVLRHRGRLRRRPQRTADRALPGRQSGPGRAGGDQDGPPGGAAARSLHAGQLPGLDRPIPGQPRGGRARSGAAALPAGCRSSAATQVFDALDTLVAEQRIRGLRGERGDLRRGSQRHRAGRAWPASRSSSTPSGRSRWTRCCRPPRPPVWGSSPGCRWRPGCCRASTPTTPSSPPTTTATTTGPARPSTSARPSPASTSTPAWRPPPSSASWSTALGPPAAVALRWVIDQPGVSTVIPGARNVAQAHANARAAELAPLPDGVLRQITELYDRRIRPDVHQRW